MSSTGNSRGRFITLEGVEGAGKTTQQPAIAEFLRDHGVEVVETREPGGSQVSEAIREILLKPDFKGMSDDAELLLMFAARAEHVQRVIRPALSAGQWVLCDRFTDATYAYQGGGRGIPDARIAVLEDWVQGDLRPDTTLFFDIDVEAGLERASQRSAKDRFEAEQVAFFERVRAAYHQRAKQEPGRFHIIDTAVSIDAVQAQVKACLQTLFQ